MEDTQGLLLPDVSIRDETDNLAVLLVPNAVRFT